MRTAIEGAQTRGGQPRSAARSLGTLTLIVGLLVGAVMPANAMTPSSTADRAQVTEEGGTSTSEALPDPGGSGAPAPVGRSMPLTPQPDAQTVADLVCTPGTFYSILEDGRLQRVAGSSVTVQSAAARSGGDFNGLGVSSDGRSAYMFDRTGTGGRTADIYSLNTADNTWARTGQSIDTSASANGRFSGSLIAGAVSSDGRFYFGGYQNSGSTTIFRLYSVSPGSGGATYHGAVTTGGATSSGSTNGDMAFDSEGNLFLVRGDGGTASIYTVTKSALSASSGGSIPSSGTNSFQAINNINGIAFDSNGDLILGNATNATRYGMPGFSNPRSVTSSLRDSGDLASCSVPPTITIQKQVTARAKAGDQFTLGLSAGGREIATTTTLGSAQGVQAQQIGPVPANRGTEVSFSEAAASGASLGDYSSSYECRADGGGTAIASGTGTSGTVTVPASAQAVVCIITNTPKSATVTLEKSWVIDGKATAHGSQPAGMTATPSLSPAGSGSGAVAWGQKRSGFTIGQSIEISETTAIDARILPGCRLDSATIAGPGIDGAKPLGSVTAAALTGSDNIYRIVNTVVCEQSLTLIKKVENTRGGTRVATDWNGKLHADRAGQPRLSYTSGQTQKVAAGTYTISETQLAGYDQKAITCTGATFNASTGALTLGQGQKAECTIANADRAGVATWSKTDESGKPLKGSVWKLTGPTGTTTLTVEDCVAASAQACTGPDKNPAAGEFQITGLAWGAYQLVEVTAPTGYLLDSTVHRFAIAGDTLEAKVGAIENEQIDPPVLPLTGGTGTDLFTLIGAVLGLGALIAGPILWRRRNRMAA